MIKISLALKVLFIGLLLNVSGLALAVDTSIETAVNNAARSDADRERDKTSKPVDVLNFFGVKPGMAVLDLFSGGGYYSEILSYSVGPEGSVLSHNNAAYDTMMGEEAINRFKEDRLANVSRVSSEIYNFKFKKASQDMILMVLTYHDIYYSAANWPKVDRDNFFRQLKETLKPGGVLAIVDHSALPNTGSTAAQDLHRIDPAFAKQDIESAGFTFQAASEVLSNADDERTLSVFDENIRRKTDRFVYRFVKK